MFFGRRGRSRASLKRASTVVTLAALVSMGFNAGVIAPSGATTAFAATPTVTAGVVRNTPPDRTKKDRPSDKLSAMGLAAQQALARAQGKKFLAVDRDACTDQDDGCEDVFDPDSNTPIVGGQAETSIAVDATGQHIVVGFNDTRGFSLNPTSVSGFMYSDNGGATFSDGGLLPITVPQTTVGTSRYPQAFGDADVKYLGGSNFVFFEIMVKAISSTGTAQTMGFHLSTDYGHTWTGPFEIAPATNPHGLLSGANARDAADKEFADVDPDSGRVMMSWSNFTATSFAPGGVEISTTYTDNILAGAAAIWTPRQILGNIAADGQASIPRFANGSPNAYVAWRRFPGGNNQNVGFARSLDNGATWQPTINLTSDFFTADQILGNDRNNTSPSLAVDNSSGPRAGTVYVVYENNNSHDGGDIAFQRSTDAGQTWSAPVLINSRPGADRSQWFPWVTVDPSTGRVGVFYYDQGIATSGDLTEVTYTYSDNGGTSWSRPVPISDRPFQAAWGNDTGQPNIGDYNQSVARGGELFAVFAATESKGFTDGEPASTSFTTPDVVFKRVPAASQASLRVSSVIAADSFGTTSIEAGETNALTIRLENYVTNALSAGTISGISATLTTSTPNVTVTAGTSAYPNVAPGAIAFNSSAFQIQTSPAFIPGTKIELVLSVATAQGSTTLRTTLLTGTPNPTTFFSENFNGVAPGGLPTGWTTAHGGGNNTVPWTTSNTFCGTTTNAAFHQNAADGLSGVSTRFERLFSPVFTVPAGGDYVTLDFDICYDTEDDPAFTVLAYDGATLRITDQTAGRILRSNLIDAFAEGLTTGGSPGLVKHLPRSSNSAYFADMSVWGGQSFGMKHVSMRLPGMAGSSIQLRWEYTQDSIGTCNDAHPSSPARTCGILIDNIVMQSVTTLPSTVVAITAPASGSLTNQTSIAISGTQANATGVTVNGIAATITGATWTATVPLPVEGANPISATATGPAGSEIARTTVRRDTVPPTVTPPADQVFEATSPAGRTVTFAQCTGTDLNGPVTFTYDPPTGSVFALGSTTVSCTGTDRAGNATTRTFLVWVVDTTPPSITAPGDQTVEATGPLGAIVTYPPCVATDAASTPMVTYSQASGTVFPLGTTLVLCTATDKTGNTADASFLVVVTDTRAPVVTVPSNIVTEATSPSGATVTFTAAAADLVDGPLTPSCLPVSGTTFPLGTTTVTCTATDAAGNVGTASFTITVRDTTPPAVTVPSNITREATGPSGAVVTFTATAADVVDGPLAPLCAPASGGAFAIGTTTVTCTASDSHGNAGTATFTITVTDTTAPTVSVPANMIIEATGTTGATATFTATATDTVSGPVGTSCSPVSGSTFALGVTTVTCTATDGQGNTGLATFTVTIRDTTPPTLTIPANITVEATGPAGAAVTFDASASDLVDGTVSAACAPASGTTFALGVTTVTCSAVDAHGNATTATFTVTVRDTIPPAVTVPANMTVEATGPTGAPAAFTASATDVVDGSITATCSPPSGATFAIGATTVTCNASDSHGNIGTATFTVTVRDTTPPAVTVPASITTEATGPDGATVAYTASAADLVDGSLVPTCSRASGSTFALGTTTVTCTATDSHGNLGTAAFTVTVRDTTAPSLIVPATITAEATGPTGAAVTFSASATDIVDGSLSATCAPASGATFALGTTNVRCSSTDAHGNTGQLSFAIIVRDTTAPVLTVPANITTFATGASGAIVTFAAIATDLVDGSITPTCAPPSGSTFPHGTTTVSCAAIDAHGNVRTGTFSVTVRVTFASLCALTTRYSTSPGVASSLCSKLNSASAAAARGSTTAADNILDAFQHELSAQSGKAFTAAQAAYLSGLADALR